ncbi:MAG: glutamate synthase-related protein, partial [Bacteroidetes bacterium]|nr:glutamate synthase-related protein [Bacteroidota bacterium]
TLIITGGLRTESDFAKAMAMGADGVAVANSALQAIGCLAMRACHTNNCPVGIATQKKHLMARLQIQVSAKRLDTYFRATVELMCVLARACGHDTLSEFNPNDLTTWKEEMARLSGVRFAGVHPPAS